ncbi:MAG: hypothetical protein PHD65_12940 [Gallionella sp.]|nr:hypothetical protein [Gallionella sp.]
MKKAIFIVKQRTKPMLAAIVVYQEATGRKGKVLVSEPIKSNFSNDDLEAAARRLVPLVPDYKVILPTGVEI